MSLKLQDVMSKQLETVNPNTTLKDAASRMVKRNIGMLPVLDDGKIKGTLTDRDICLKAVAAGWHAAETPVSKAMSPDAVTCEASAGLEDAAKEMARHKVRRLIVADNGTPVGVLSLGDLARAGSDPSLAGRTLKAVAH